MGGGWNRDSAAPQRSARPDPARGPKSDLPSAAPSRRGGGVPASHDLHYGATAEQHLRLSLSTNLSALDRLLSGAVGR